MKDIFDAAFAAYGRVINNIDTEEMQAVKT